MRRTLLGFLAGGLVLVLAGCAPTHRLADVTLEERTVAVSAPMPTHQRVVFSPWPFLDTPSYPRSGGVAERRFEAARAAQGRFDRALSRIDVFELLASRTIAEASQMLGFEAISDPDEATYLLDVRLLEIRFLARSFDSPIQLVSEAEVTLFERGSDEVMWRRHTRTRTRIAPDDVGVDLPEASLTPRMMTRLTAADMETVIVNAAAIVGWEIARELSRDYERAHR